jgi:hypothetical protein
MAKRRSFVPESPMNASLEGRVVLSTLGAIGDWFTSQYNNVKEDLGITQRPPQNAAAGIQQLWNDSAKLSKPVHEKVAPAHHAKAMENKLVIAGEETA